MTNTKIFLKLQLLLCAFFLFSFNSAFAADAEEKLEKGDLTADGLRVTKLTRRTAVELKEGVDWSQYNKYLLAEVPVAFKKDWQRDYNRDQRNLQLKVTDDDVLRIKEDLGKLVYEQFDTAMLEKSGMTKPAKPDASTMIIKLAVINLDVNAPDVNRAPAGYDVYNRQAGEMTLFLEVYDGVSGERLARWVDAREDMDKGYAQWADRITNTQAAKQICQNWTKRLLEGFEKLKEGKTE